MLIRNNEDGFIHPLGSEITSKEAYATRREMLRRWSAGAAAAGLAGWGHREAFAQGGAAVKLAALPANQSTIQGAMTLEKLTTQKDATTYNNFYEFGTDKSDPARQAHTLKTSPWSIEVEGLVKKPTRFNLEDIMKWGAMQERIYRLRCVEGWSMVIPWNGFELADLLALAGVQSGAKYVAFETLQRPEEMPGLRYPVLEWPYVEGLRLDEAVHPLTIMATGIYGKDIPNQNGAPIRLVVPWKYGFKNIKAIVRITLTDTQPACTWNKMAPQEYGFYANVNPQVDHPRWSQASERRIGAGLLAGRQDTLMFNGYGDEVASLYAGMDLMANY